MTQLPRENYAEAFIRGAGIGAGAVACTVAFIWAILELALRIERPPYGPLR